MKVILSRKGMDSQYGGIPSPIIKSEYSYSKFFSLPIPTVNSNLRYKDLFMFDNNKVSDFLNDLGKKTINYDLCHLDPDIRKTCLKIRPPEWKRNFGQVGIAQQHLLKNQIEKGDVFLFFGWFQYAEYKNGKFQFIKNDEFPNGFHAIYSYLQIDQIYKPNIEEIPVWLRYHPHFQFRNESEFKNPNNTIYVASEKFNYSPSFNKNGSISFVFDKSLILTKSGESRRSRWELPIEFHPQNGISLSYNPIKRWQIKNGKAILDSSARGQEFIFSDKNQVVENWCIELIKMHTVTD